MTRPRRPQPKKSRLAQLLIDSGYKPLAFVGRGIATFGLQTVLAFLLGAACLYLVALFVPVPIIGQAGKEPAPPEDVLLSGTVETVDGEPLTRYRIGVLRGGLQGPFRNDTGKFDVRVPPSELYNFIVLPPDRFHPATYYGNRRVLRDDSGKYTLEQPLTAFPTNLGRMQGEVRDFEGRAATGTVEINGIKAPIDPSGWFDLKDIPLGRTTVVIRNRDGEIVHQEDIDLDVADTTPHSFDVEVSP